MTQNRFVRHCLTNSEKGNIIMSEIVSNHMLDRLIAEIEKTVTDARNQIRKIGRLYYWECQ